jgi:hypothetical protein
MLVALLAGPAVAQEATEEPSSLEDVLALYEWAKQAGEVPKDVYTWAKEDLANIGDWEYMVVQLDLAGATALEFKLNELGADRWELIWVNQEGSKVRLVLKRSVRTWLTKLPLSELLKMLPGAPGGDEGGS